MALTAIIGGDEKHSGVKVRHITHSIEETGSYRAILLLA